MEALDIARWQFGITTLYHFIFVPLTIGLAPIIAIMQTIWVVTKKEHWLRLTKFFGKLFLINFAIGVVTGIVQEFQFGMNWSEYSRFVGDIFGAPLAMEGLAAFFIESTFLGLWIFGWDRLPKKVHLACIWLVAFSVNLSALFIIAANSWMQHPVGADYNPETGRAELNDIFAVIFNSTAWAALPHTIMAAWLVSGTFMAGVAGWLMVRHVRKNQEDIAKNLYRPAVLFGLVVILLGGVGLAITGDYQGKLMYEQQPMKMSAAEANCIRPDDGSGTPFSLLAFGDFSSNNCEDVNQILEIPGLTSFLAKSNFNTQLPTVGELQERYTELYQDPSLANPDPEGTNYVPNLFVAYWSFRLMIGFALGSAVLAIVGLWMTRGGRVTGSKWFKWICLVAIPTPFLGTLLGWVFTEMGRQPWIVVPNPTGSADIRMLTADGVSGVSPATVWTSLIVFTLLYGVLAVIWFYLMKRYASSGALHDQYTIKTKDDDHDDDNAPLSFAY